MPPHELGEGIGQLRQRFGAAVGEADPRELDDACHERDRRRAAAATGVTYVDMNQVSEGHDACKPLGVRWIEPVLQGTNPVIVHPNALGEAQMAAQTKTVCGCAEAAALATRNEPGDSAGVGMTGF